MSRVDLSNSGFLTALLKNGAFSSSVTQTTVGNEIKAMTYDSTDISNGVTLQNNSQLKVSVKGIYNLQFSAQIIKTTGGTNETVNIWFRKNGIDIPNSNTLLSLANNSQFIVAAWNIFVSMNINDYVEIMWYSTDSHIQLQYSPATANYPVTPSVIATLNNIMPL